MVLRDILRPESIVPALRVMSKKQALQELSQLAARLSGIDSRIILEQLAHRERIGSTSVGNGVAIPHGRIAGLDRLRGVFARLERPVEYEAPDGRPVDLMFVLLTPEHADTDHLQALSRIARSLRDPDVVQSLRNTADANVIYAVLCGERASYAA